MSTWSTGIAASQLPLPSSRRWASPQPVPPAELLAAELTLDGAGSDPDMNVDGSVTPVDFEYIVPNGEVLILERIDVAILDTGIEPQLFGALAALTNGLLLRLVDADDTVLVSLSPNGAYKQNIDFELIAAGSTLITQGGGTTDEVVAQYDLHNVHGYSTFLTGGQKIQAVVQDNLAGLEYMRMGITGRLMEAG